MDRGSVCDKFKDWKCVCMRWLPYGPSTNVSMLQRQKPAFPGPGCRNCKREERLDSSRGEPFDANARSHMLQHLVTQEREKKKGGEERPKAAYARRGGRAVNGITQASLRFAMWRAPWQVVCEVYLSLYPADRRKA
jgi:hypothetical protein